VVVFSNLQFWSEAANKGFVLLISNFGRALNVVFFLLGDSPAPEFYMPTFRNSLHIHWLTPPMKMEQGVSKRRHIKLRRRGITQKERIQHGFVCVWQNRVNCHPENYNFLRSFNACPNVWSIFYLFQTPVVLLHITYVKGCILHLGP
jgi:hypothetical protein